MNTPLVSVLMPAYNAEKYIAKSIQSILDQTFKDFELIIIDDASTDKTFDISQEFKDKRIILIRNEKNLYIAENRNKALSFAKGKYIVWQDADDISYKYRLEKQVEFMEKTLDVGICGGYLDSFTNEKITDTRKYFSDDKNLRKRIFKQSPVAQPSAIIRKECFTKVGLYNVKYPPAEDLDMSFRIGTHYKFANLQISLIKYREHPNSATFQKFTKIILMTLRIRLNNINNKAYSFSFFDFVYQIVTLIALFLPTNIIINGFKRFRKVES